VQVTKAIQVAADRCGAVSSGERAHLQPLAHRRAALHDNVRRECEATRRPQPPTFIVARVKELRHTRQRRVLAEQGNLDVEIAALVVEPAKHAQALDNTCAGTGFGQYLRWLSRPTSMSEPRCW
jgi:hypothetical protein